MEHPPPEFPCGKKCLAYPICRSQTAINCTTLITYYLECCHKNFIMKWDIITEAFPNLKIILMTHQQESVIKFGYSNPLKASDD